MAPVPPAPPGPQDDDSPASVSNKRKTTIHSTHPPNIPHPSVLVDPLAPTCGSEYPNARTSTNSSPQRVAKPVRRPPTLPGNRRGTRDPFRNSISVPYKSPTPSDFGEPQLGPHGNNVGATKLLPPDILEYLNNRELEAHLVCPDGNCLYRAITYGPKFPSHRVARLAAAGYIDGILDPGENSVLRPTKEDENWIRKGQCPIDW
jgi:hypothetical protein